MFTGIVEETGRVAHRDETDGDLRLLIETNHVGVDGSIGDSIAVSGVCLTVTSFRDGQLAFDVSEETISKTTASEWQIGTRLNLERSLRVGDRLGGHLMYGHIDGTTTVASMRDEGDGARLTIDLPERFLPFVVPKGSIGIDGVSLTLATLQGQRASIALVPHTLAITTLGELRPGDRVNVELDVLGKYVVRHLEVRQMDHDSTGPDIDSNER